MIRRLILILLAVYLFLGSFVIYANDIYTMLGLSRSATIDELDKEYKKARRESHPDKARVVGRDRGLSESEIEELVRQYDDKFRMLGNLYDQAKSSSSRNYDPEERNSWSRTYEEPKIDLTKDLLNYLHALDLVNKNALAYAAYKFLMQRLPCLPGRLRRDVTDATIEIESIFYKITHTYAPTNMRFDILQAAYEGLFLYLSSNRVKVGQSPDNLYISLYNFLYHRYNDEVRHGGSRYLTMLYEILQLASYFHNHHIDPAKSGLTSLDQFRPASVVLQNCSVSFTINIQITFP